MASATPKKKATTAQAWKKDAQGTPLDVPSGHTALVRPVGMQVFLQKGMIPNSLMPIIRESMKSGKPADMAMEEINEEQISDMMALFDAVTCYVVVEPKVTPTPMRDDGNGGLEPVPIEDRAPDMLYADEVDFEDKSFIFQWVVGGTRDLEQFRRESAAALEHVRPSQDVADTGK